MKTVKRIVTFFLIMSIFISGAGAVCYAADTEGGETAEGASDAEISEEKETDGDETGKLKIDVSFDELDGSQVIHDGVAVGNTDIGGMTPDEALAAVNAEIEELGRLPVTIKVDDRSMELSLAELGFYCDNAEQSVVDSALIGQVGSLINRYKEKTDLSENEVVYNLNFGITKEAVSEYMAGNAENYTIEPVNASIKRRGNGFDLTESIMGIQIDQGATVDIIMDAFNSWNQDAINVQASTVVLEPDYNYEDLAKIKDCIGSFYTKLSGSANSGKGKNVSIGAGKIDGTVIMPGEEWSIYETLAPFTVENGYDEATAYLNGAYVQELGGGVCQLATTLYNAALRSEITVSERFCHQMTVGYTDVSFDATVNDYGTKDLKLTNNFDFPVYIEAYFSDGKVCFNIYGVETRDPRRTLGFRSEVLSEEYPTEVEETLDPTLPAGTRKVVQKAYPKVIAKAYKQVYYDGVLIEETYLHTDNYHASAEKVLVGTKAVEAAAEPKPQETAAPPQEVPVQETSAAE